MELQKLYPMLAGVEVQEPVVYSLRYGGDFLECASAFYAASVLVSKFGGIAFAPEAGMFLTEAKLLEGAEACASETSE